MKKYLSVFLAVLFIVPVGVMQSFAADRVDYVVVGVVRLALFAGTFADGFLHGFPLFVGDFELFNSLRIEFVAINDYILYSASAVRFERYAIDSAHPSFFGVVGAVL